MSGARLTQALRGGLLAAGAAILLAAFMMHNIVPGPSFIENQKDTATGAALSAVPGVSTIAGCTGTAAGAAVAPGGVTTSLGPRLSRSKRSNPAPFCPRPAA